MASLQRLVLYSYVGVVLYRLIRTVSRVILHWFCCVRRFCFFFYVPVFFEVTTCDSSSFPLCLCSFSFPLCLSVAQVVGALRSLLPASLCRAPIDGLSTHKHRGPHQCVVRALMPPLAVSQLHEIANGLGCVQWLAHAAGHGHLSGDSTWLHTVSLPRDGSHQKPQFKKKMATVCHQTWLSLVRVATRFQRPAERRSGHATSSYPTQDLEVLQRICCSVKTNNKHVRIVQLFHGTPTIDGQSHSATDIGGNL